jgi:hypothetical protein
LRDRVLVTDFAPFPGDWPRLVSTIDHYCFARLSAKQPHDIQICPKGLILDVGVTKYSHSLAMNSVRLMSLCEGL